MRAELQARLDTLASAEPTEENQPMIEAARGLIAAQVHMDELNAELKVAAEGMAEILERHEAGMDAVEAAMEQCERVLQERGVDTSGRPD